MKVLTLYTRKFSYTPANKNLDWAPEVTAGAALEELVVAFIQVEESDEMQDIRSREKKLVNHLKWVCRKNNTQSVVLHSFAHLSDSKASPEYTLELLNEAEKRLVNSDYRAIQTPFGYFLDLNIEAPGFSMARIWAEL